MGAKFIAGVSIGVITLFSIGAIALLSVGVITLLSVGDIAPLPVGAIAPLSVGASVSDDVLAGVASGSGVRIVVRLLSLSPLVSLESSLLAVGAGAAELLKPASVGSGTGRKAKNNPAAISAKITAPVIIAPALGFLPSSRAII